MNREVKIVLISVFVTVIVEESTKVKLVNKLNQKFFDLNIKLAKQAELLEVYDLHI